MRSLKILAVLALSALPLGASAQQLESTGQVVDRIVAQEQAEIQLLRQYSPLVETYIQYLRPDKETMAMPNGDKYFLGRAELVKGIELEPLKRDAGLKRRLLRGLREFFSTEFVPRGFLQMIYLDMDGFDRQHYNIQYRRREFLGEVRCLVFDVNPLPNSGKGRFVGRVWVEDQDYHIVRFNGAYGGFSLTSDYFNFDSWRTNVGKNLWLPAFVYTAEGDVHDPKTARLAFKPFRAQTRLWGYNLGNTQEEEELSKVLIEAPTPINDSTETANDLSPIQAQRYWNRQAEMNVMDHLERQGLLAPHGEVDEVLETVVKNLEVTNDLDIQPEVRCRVLMTSTLESFTMGHTIVLSRGLVDVLPDEPSLAAILAHELGHVILGHRIDTQFGFFDSMQFSDKETFRHFDFARTPEEERAANEKGVELLANSPYRDSRTAPLFLQALKNRSKEIPELISPHLGDGVPTSLTLTSGAFSPESEEKPAANVIAALPLGGRIKVDPWNDQLRMLKSQPVGTVAESEKMPFQITPFVFYLTRDNSSVEGKGAVAAKIPNATKP
ncbi:MAG TPA: M48 family metalloprotease [Candidatus Dormibacteraeota bacterium]|nr:M48 family metalloprotease [Candidatus Dormibacteraeota bacterium]